MIIPDIDYKSKNKLCKNYDDINFDENDNYIQIQNGEIQNGN